MYTLVELGAAPRARVIGAIRELLVGATDTDAAFARLTARDTRIVSLTVTEKGYCLDAKNQLDAGQRRHRARPRQSAANRAAPSAGSSKRLRRRRAQGVPPFAVLSCDNLPDNGKVLHRALVRFRAHAPMPDFARWIEAEVVCPRTMVDSITPATDDALRKRAPGTHRRASTSGRFSASRSLNG